MNTIFKKLSLFVVIAGFTATLQAQTPANNRFLGVSTSKRSLIKKGVQGAALLSPFILELALGKQLSLSQLALAEGTVALGSYLVTRYNLSAKHAADVATRVGLVTLFYAVAQMAMPHSGALTRYGIPALGYLLVKVGPYEWWVKKYFKEH